MLLSGVAFLEAFQPSLTLTYEQLPQKVYETAAAFKHAGAKRGDVVAM